MKLSDDKKGDLIYQFELLEWKSKGEATALLNDYATVSSVMKAIKFCRLHLDEIEKIVEESNHE